MRVEESTILKILEREVSLTGPVEVGYTTSLRHEAELDSLDLSVFLLAIQEEYHIKISDAEMAKLDTVAQISEWLNSHLK